MPKKKKLIKDKQKNVCLDKGVLVIILCMAGLRSIFNKKFYVSK